MSDPRPRLDDQDHRDLAATELSENYLVEASAGTGKTRLLIDRILFILRETLTPVSRIVAITFTEKAAGELKVKLRTRLEEELRAGRDVEDHYHQALLHLDSMPVSTIHAFCRELIQEHPVEAGVDPDSTLADENMSARLRDEVWTEWLRAELQHDCPALRPWLELGVRAEAGRGSLSLRAIFDLLRERRDELDTLHVDAPDQRTLQANLRGFIARAQSALGVRVHCTDPNDRLALHMLAIERWLRQGTELPLEQWSPWLLTPPSFKVGNRGSKPKWPLAGDVVAARELVVAIGAEFAELCGDYLSWAAHELLAWLKGAVVAFQREQERRALLDFDDLLIRARDLLRDHHIAREELKQRFDYLLIDEFQDTDSRQVELVCFLAEQPGYAAEHWRDTLLEPGKLFIVGDPKQSIYRFRRADLDLYGEVKRKITDAGAELRIWMNFRCHPAIIAEVNALFPQLMESSDRAVYEPEYIPLSPTKSDQSPLPPLVILTPSAAWRADSPSAATAAGGEAAAIAAHIEQLARAGVAYGDIAILYPKRTHLEPLEDALRRLEIPFDTAAGRGFGQRLEVRALASVLAAVQNPFDEAGVVAALRTPFFACSDDDLLAHKLSGAAFNYLRDNSPRESIAAAFELLREWHGWIGRRSSPEILRDILERTPALALYALKPRGEGRLANLLKVLETARGLEQASACSLHDLRHWLDRLDERWTQEQESAVTESADSVVRLLTFHQAKGLEFPVVILYQLAGNPLHRGRLLLDRHTGALEIAVRAAAVRQLATRGFTALREREAARARFEQIRLLYVAMTRAEQQLVLPLVWQSARVSGEDLSYIPLLRSHFGISEAGAVDAPRGATVVVHESPPAHRTLSDAIRLPAHEPFSPDAVAVATQAFADWQEWSRTALRSLHRERRFRHASAHGGAPGSGDTPAESLDRDAAIRFGNFVHRVLQQVDLPRGEQLPALLRELRDPFDLTADQLAVAETLIGRYLRTDLVTRRLAQAEHVFREVPFAYEAAGSLFEGSIDLLCLEQEGVVIVDYKTDSVSAADALRRADVYREQLNIYADAVRRATGRTVRECLLCFLRPGVVVPVAPMS